MVRLAKIFSYLFHPLLMPTVGVILIFNTNSFINFTIPDEKKNAVYILIFLTTFLIPLMLSLLLLTKGFIQSLDMDSPKERMLPYGFTILFYLFTLYLLKQAMLPQIIFTFIIGATMAVTLAFLINMKWKISAHMIGIGGLVGALVIVALSLQIYITPFIVLSILVAGIIGVSRLILEAHTPAQIYTGFLLGVLSQIFALVIL